MAASHRAAKLEASSLQTPENPSVGAQVAQNEREDPSEALAAAAAAALEEEEGDEEEKAVLPALAGVMQGRDGGWGWVSAGRGLRAGLRPRWAKRQARKWAALSISALPSKPGPPGFSLLPWKITQNGSVGKSFNFQRKDCKNFLESISGEYKVQKFTPFASASVGSSCCFFLFNLGKTDVPHSG